MGCASSSLDSKIAEQHRRHAPEDTDSDDDDDYVDDVAPAASLGRRKMSVSAEAYSDNQLASREAKLTRKPVAVPAAQVNKIIALCQKISLFNHIDAALLRSLAGHWRKAKYNRDAIVIRQGDDGNDFYIIDQGEVEVYVTSSKKAVLKKTCRAGDGFGELALLYNAPRAATCKVSSKTATVWALGRDHFTAIMRASTMQTRSVHSAFVKQVPVLEKLTDYERLTIADALQEQEYKAGDIVLKQGEAGDMFFIVKEGTAECTRAGEKGVLASLKAGDYFGEIALLTPNPRQATVTAATPLVVLTMERATFNRVMGSLKDILNRKMGGYKSFVQQHGLKK